MKMYLCLVGLLLFFISCKEPDLQGQINNRPDLPSPVKDLPGYLDKITNPPGCAHCADKQGSEPEQEKGGFSGGPVCDHFKSFVKQGVPKDALKQALSFYSKHKSTFKSSAGKRFISIADYSSHSGKKRFFLLDMKSGKVKRSRVSHGSGKVHGVNYSDKAHNGYVDRCTHPKGNGAAHSRWAMTRPGFFKTGGLATSGKHIKSWPMMFPKQRGNKMTLKGLSPGVNEDAMRNGVVMHEAYYNSPRNGTMGRSFGCPAFEPGEGKKVISKIKGGSLFYGYMGTRVCKPQMNKVLRQVPNWKKMCSN